MIPNHHWHCHLAAQFVSKWITEWFGSLISWLSCIQPDHIHIMSYHIIYVELVGPNHNQIKSNTNVCISISHHVSNIIQVLPNQVSRVSVNTIFWQPILHSFRHLRFGQRLYSKGDVTKRNYWKILLRWIEILSDAIRWYGMYEYVCIYNSNHLKIDWDQPKLSQQSEPPGLLGLLWNQRYPEWSVISDKW